MNHKLLLAAVFGFGTVGSFARGHLDAAAQSESDFHQICESSFAKWDGNQNGYLEAAEINALLENPQVRGAEAAALVTIHSHFSQTNEAMSLQQVLAFADERRAQNDYLGTLQHIESVNRTLFPPGEPSISAIHQGALGDCYLLAVVGAVVNRDSETVRNMIQPLPDGGYDVHFPTGKIISVSALTDAELVMLPGMDGYHGIWVAVLEKAYAKIRQDNQDERTGEVATPSNSIPRDWLRGGRAPPTIEQWTGHKAQRMVLQREFGNDTQKAMKTLDPLLTTLSDEKRIIAAGKNNHLFGLLSYDHAHQMVRLFNPHGETFSPTSPPGIANGFVTLHGVFDVPLSDFVQMFHTLSWETDEPLDKQ